MRKVFALILSLILVTVACGQQIQEPTRVFVRSNFAPPSDTIIPAIRRGEIRHRTADTLLYTWTGFRWRPVGLPIDTAVISTKDNVVKVVSDTSLLLREIIAITDANLRSYADAGSLYKSSGSLTSNRIVTMGSFTLDFSNDIRMSGARFGTRNANFYLNTVGGMSAMDSVTTAFQNTAFGYQAGAYMKTNTENTYIGALAGRGSQTAGFEGIAHLSTANRNTAIGQAALMRITGGDDNNAFGSNALNDLTTGVNNAVMGSYSLANLTTGSFNTVMGVDAGSYVMNGNNNVLVGHGVGRQMKGSNNVMIGFEVASSGWDSVDNELAIDNGPTTSPLLRGNFARDSLAVNGQLTVRDLFRLPRMTTAARNAIVNPLEGSMVMDTTVHKPSIFDGTLWKYFTLEAGGTPPDGAGPPPLTIAALRAINTSQTAGQEYYLTDAGRQGFVRYDNADASSADNNGTIFVTTNNLRFKRLDFQGNFHDPATDTTMITWFGANGADSTFDNTDIFEAIIGRNFKRIHIPDGIYRINFSSLNNFNGPDSKFRGLMLRANQRWTGNGTHRSVVLMDGVVNDNPSTYYSLFSGHGGGAIDTCDNVTFRGFTIRGKNYGGVPTNTINEAIGIYQGWSASHFTVDSMKFEYIFGHGHADFATFGGKFGWNTVTNNIYLFNGKNGANLNTPDLIFTGNYGRKNIFSLLEAATGRAIIMNNIAEENDFIGIAVGGFGDSLDAVNNGRYNIISNNVTFGNKQRGIHLAGGTSYSLVFNNLSYYNGAYGIGVTEDFSNIDLGPNQIATRNNYVFNNVSYDNGEVGNPSPMGVYLLASENRIFNNTIYRTGALTWRGRNFDQKWGIISEATKGNHQVFNNTIYGSHSLGDYYYRVGNNLVWTDTTRLTTPHNPTFIVSVDPFANNSPFLWTQVFGSLNMSAPTGYNNALTGIDPNSTHTLRLAYNGGADSITFITTRPPTIELGADTTINSLSNISLNSTASDADGSIASYQWHIMRRPFGSTSTLTNATSATATLTNVAYGQYYIMCEVTDDKGSKGVDYRKITVQ